MVKLENIKFQIKDKIILDDVSVNFEKSKLNIVLGPNGSGKSTLIKIISKEIIPNNGNVIYENQNLDLISISELSTYRAVLSQNIEVAFPLSVSEIILMGRYPHFKNKPNKIDFEICENALNLFDLTNFKNRNYLSLSGGEKQRVQFARVFAQIWLSITQKPRLLLLDEPLTFLDIYYQYDLMDKIKLFMKNNSDLTVIGIVHDLNIASKYAYTLTFIKNGKIYKQGLTKEILTEQNIFNVFNINVKNNFII